MSLPGNINPAPPPSSFDNDPDFFEESRWAKLKRRLVEEPLIPLGCALTCWALLEATRSVRSGDRERTNRMFRRRIYAQFFTIVTVVAGSYYWESDRAKRKQFDALSAEKQRQERSAAWVKELEARDEEENDLRRIRDTVAGKGKAIVQAVQKEESQVSAAAREGSSGKVQSVLESGEGRADGPILSAVRDVWERRRS